MFESKMKKTILRYLPFFSFYLHQGMITALIFQGIVGYFRNEGMNLAQLSWLYIAMMPWIGKFLWSPWFERNSLTLFKNRYLGSLVLIQVTIILEDFLDVKDEKTTALALEYLQISSELLPKDTLITLLFHQSIEISLSALNIAGKRLHNDYIPAIISNLSNIKLAIIARETLLLYDDEKVLNGIENELNKKNINKDLIFGIVRCLSSYSHKKSLEMLRFLLTNKDLELSIQVSNSMMKIAKTSKLKNEFQTPYYEEIDFFSKQYLEMNMLSLDLNNTINPNHIFEQISCDKKKIVHIMLKLIF